MTNDDDFTTDSFDIDEFGADVSAMLTRRSLDVPTNARPLPSLDRPVDSAADASGRVVQLEPTRTKGDPTERRFGLAFAAAAAALAVIVGAVFVFTTQSSESDATTVIADDPTSTLATPDPTPTLPAPTATPFMPSPTPEAWLMRESFDRIGTLEYGIRSTTSIDEQVQAASERALAELPAELRGVAVTIDAKTGAIVGATNFAEAGNLVERHPIGSTVHLYTLVAAFEAGYQADDLVNGIGPCTFEVGADNRSVTLLNFGNSLGNVDTIEKQALRSSRCAFAELEQLVGSDKVQQVVARLTTRSSTPAPSTLVDDSRLLEAGEIELSVVEQASALATLVNRGLFIEPTMITGWQDSATGTEGVLRPPLTAQRFNADVSGNVLDILRTNVGSGTGTRADVGGGPIAGITGSDPLFERAWFIGVRGRLVTAVVVLAKDGGPMTNVGGLANVTGGSLPAATFGSIHSALRAHPLAVDDQSDAWVRAVEMRDPLALGSADAAPPQTTELPPPPIIGDGAGGNCPRTHPVGIDVNGDGLAEVCYETTFVAGQTCPTGTTLKQQAAPDNIDSDADLHACLPD